MSDYPYREPYEEGFSDGKDEAKERIAELQAENAKLRGLMSEALSNMEYYPASLGEHGLVQDSDITAMQEALLQEKGE